MSAMYYITAVIVTAVSTWSPVHGGGPPLPTEPENPEFHEPCRIATIDTSDVVSLKALAASRDNWGILYTINYHKDPQNDNIIHTVDAMTGKSLGNIGVKVVNLTVDGWSDLAVGPCSTGSSENCIYILDKTVILKVREPTRDQASISSEAEVVETFLIDDHDQKSLFVGLDSTLYYMSSVDYGQSVTLYKVDRSGLIPILYTVTSTALPSSSLGPISADLSPDGTELLILMQDNTYLYQISNNDVKTALQSQAATILPITPFPLDFELTWSPSGKGYYLATGNDRDEEIQLYYSARCNDLPAATSPFAAGQPIRVLSAEEIDRMSGLAASRTHPGLLYVVSDGSDVVPLFDPTKTNPVASFTLSGVTGGNWKDVSVSTCQTGSGNCLYILDDRKKTVYVVSESDNVADSQLQPEVITFTTPSIIFFSNSIMVSPDGIIYLLEWNAQSFSTGVSVYQLNNNAGTWSADIVATFYPNSANAGPEAADISPDGAEVLVKMRDRVLYYKVKDGDYVSAFSSEPESLPYVPERRGNVIAWSEDGSAYYTADTETSLLTKYDRQ